MVDNAADNVYPNSSGAEMGAFWNADSFNDDQYSQVTLSSLTAGLAIGASVRGVAGGTYYGLYMEGSTYYLFRMNSGTWTQLATGTESWVDADTLRLEVSGSTTCALVMKHNGVQFGSTYNDTSGSRLTSGAAGVCGYGDSSTPRLDNWEGGNLGGGGGGVTSAQVDRGRVLARGLGRGLL